MHGVIGIASSLGILDPNEEYRVLNYMPLAHMFGVGTLITLTYLGIVCY